MTSQLTVVLFCKVRVSSVCLAYCFLTRYPRVFVQPGYGRRPVDWCRNVMHEMRYAMFNGIDKRGLSKTTCSRALTQDLR